MREDARDEMAREDSIHERARELYLSERKPGEVSWVNLDAAKRRDYYRRVQEAQ